MERRLQYAGLRRVRLHSTTLLESPPHLRLFDVGECPTLVGATVYDGVGCRFEVESEKRQLISPIFEVLLTYSERICTSQAISN